MRRNRSRTIPFLDLSYDPEIEATLCKLEAKRKRIFKESPQSTLEPIVEMTAQTFGQMGSPTPAHSTASCIAKPEIEVENFELRTHLIQFIERNQFGGSASENPHDHLYDFMDKCDTKLTGGVSQDDIRMRLFPFSLRDKTKTWSKSEPANKYTTWEGLATGFLTKFFPPTKTTQLRTEIQTLKQKPLESFHEAWERFKELQRQCPHHEVPKWLLIQSFYAGISDDHRSSVTAACGGDISSKIEDELLNLFEKITQNSASWGNERDSFGRSSTNADNKVLNALTQQVSMLTSKLEKLSTSSSSAQVHMIQTCEVCGVKGHGADSCSMTFPQEEINALYGNTYNPNFKHLNLSYRRQNMLNPQSMV